MIRLLFVIQNIKAILALQPYADYKGIQFIFAATVSEALSIIRTEPIDAWIIDQWSQEIIKVQAEQSLKPPLLFLMTDAQDASLLPPVVSSFLPQRIDVAVLEQVLRDIDSRGLVPHREQQCGELIGDSEVMLKLYDRIHRVAPTDASVFILGQTGSGKELVAKAIHQLSARAAQPYLAVNCGAMNDELLSSALFGHEKGSFTGAIQSHKGYFEQASGGTLFLDEITETSQHLQISLLRALETQQVMPVGAKRLVAVDVRVLASSNRDPLIAIKKQLLREDLYHRLNVFPIHVPSLAEHRQDIPLLVAYFLQQYNEQYQWSKQMSAAALAALMDLPYSGNIRQLKNLIYRAFILADAVIEPQHLE